MMTVLYKSDYKKEMTLVLSLMNISCVELSVATDVIHPFECKSKMHKKLEYSENNSSNQFFEDLVLNLVNVYLLDIAY